MTDAKIVVEICNFNDVTLKEALKGLSLQSRLPDRVLIADGGSNDDYLRSMKSYQQGDADVSKLNIEWKILKGTPLETREKSIDYLAEEITAFLDSDEVPLSNWLEDLTAPIVEGKADFTGGAMKSVVSRPDFISSYYKEIEDRVYGSDVYVDVSYMPLGNTAWKTEILRKLRFDLRLAKSGGEAEDYDLEMRAIDAGYKGKYVPAALVKHFQNFPKGYWELMRKRYSYLLGAAIVMTKNKRLGKRAREKRMKLKHPFGKVETLMKPIALMHGFIRWHIVTGRKTHH